MSNGERSVYWPIMVAASIGALGTMAAAIIQRPELARVLVASAAPRARRARVPAEVPPDPVIAVPVIAPAPPKPVFPAHWIDAKGRYYEVKLSGDRFGIIAYKGGADAAGDDSVRMVGEGSLNAGAIRWSWQGQHGDKIEECVGNESPSAIAVSCTRPGHGGYALRLVVR